MTVVLVCGGRDFNDRDKVFAELDRLHCESPFTKLIHGGARGVDRIAGTWAAARKVPYEVFYAEWSMGKAAGHIRNGEMLQRGKPDLVVAFPGGLGTNNMKAQARRANVQVKEIS